MDAAFYNETTENIYLSTFYLIAEESNFQIIHDGICGNTVYVGI
jgi:hypothetical protein